MRQRENVGNAQERHPNSNRTVASLETRCFKRPETDVLLVQELKVQYAFSILLIRGILPFTALIAICGVLHRYQCRDIRR
jgi:hypothetical protein